MITIVTHYRNRKEYIDAYLSKIQSFNIQTPYKVVVI